MANYKKNFAWNIIGTSVNAITSLFYLIFVTRINGTNDAGVFTFCFSTALFFQVIGYYSGRVFQVTENNKKISDSDYLYLHIVNSLVMIIVCILFAIIKQYDLLKIILLLVLVLFRALETLGDCLYAIIQKKDELYKVGISFFVKALISLLLFLIIDLITKSVILASISLILVQIVIILFYDIKNIRKYSFKLKKFKAQNLRYLYISGFYTFIFSFLTQYVINAPKYAIDSLLSNHYQTIYGIIAMPATIMILIGQFLIHPFLTQLTAKIKERKYTEFNNTVFKLLIIMFILGVLISIVAYLIGSPILQMIYGVNMENTKWLLFLIIIGSTLYGMVMILSNSLIALRKTLMQAVIFAVVSLIALFLSDCLINIFSLKGAVYSYLLSMLLLFILYTIYYFVTKRRLKNG